MSSADHRRAAQLQAGGETEVPEWNDRLAAELQGDREAEVPARHDGHVPQLQQGSELGGAAASGGFMFVTRRRRATRGTAHALRKEGDDLFGERIEARP